MRRIREQYQLGLRKTGRRNLSFSCYISCIMLKGLAAVLLAAYIFPTGVAEMRDAHLAAKGNRPSFSNAPIAPQNADGPKLQPEHREHIDADVRVVSSPSKDGYDRAAFWISCVLALVGCGGVGIGICTVLSINRQVREAKLQRIVTHNTLSAIKEQGLLMKRQADAMDRQNKAFRDRERARIAVIFPPAEPDFASQVRIVWEEPELLLPIAIAVHNEGSTKAFSVRATGAFQFQEKDMPFVPVEIPLPFSIQDVIRDEDVNNPVQVLIEISIAVSDVDALAAARKDFYTFGEIVYTDIFGARRTTPFRFLWAVEAFIESDGTQGFYSEWINQSPRST